MLSDHDKKPTQGGSQDKIHLFSCDPTVFHDVLAPNELKVYSSLSARADKDRRCHPSYKDISADCHISVSTVFRSIKNLKQRGFIDVIPQNRKEIFGNNGRSVNLYILKNASPPSEAESPQSFPSLSGTLSPAPTPSRRKMVKKKACFFRRLPRKRKKHRHFPFFTAYMTPSPMSPAAPQRTMPRKKVTLKQRKKELFSRLTKWNRLHVYPTLWEKSKWFSQSIPP